MNILKEKSGRRRVAAHLIQLPSIRRWLIGIARQRGTVTLGNIAAVFGLGKQGAAFARNQLTQQSKQIGEPLLGALIVHARTGRNTEVITWGADDDVVERERVYDYWKSHYVGDQIELTSIDIQIRATKFAIKEMRPDQAAFRRKVFIKYGGKCAISGCSIEEVLDAAHKHGRIWSEGHNSAADGILLRKDLHALYDSGLLSIDNNGCLCFTESAAAHYSQFSAVIIQAWKP